MQVKVNGEDRSLTEGTTVRQLLDTLGLKDRPVAVEINRQLVPRKLHESTAIHGDDVIEVVTFVGGG